MAYSQVSLPPELWYRVVLQHNDPEHLWACRDVCPKWRSDIPNIFAQKYIPDPLMVEVYFDCGVHKVNGSKHAMGMQMMLDRFEEDDGRCVFKESPETADPNSAWAIRIKKAANDTELPGLRFDFNKHEISFQWLPMLQSFYRETREYNRRIGSWVDDMAPKIEAQKAGREGINDVNEMMTSMKQFFSAHKDHRRDVRRVRIKQWYEQHANIQFTYRIFEKYAPDEDAALEQINECMKGVDFADFPEDADEDRAAAERERDDTRTGFDSSTMRPLGARLYKDAPRYQTARRRF